MQKYYFFLIVIVMVIVAVGCRLYKSKLKMLLTFFVNSVAGTGVLYVVNLVGGQFNFHIGINYYTIIGTGLLGIPGLVLAGMLKFLC